MRGRTRNRSTHGPDRRRDVPPRTGPPRPATVGAVLAELERCQQKKVVLDHLATLLWREFAGEGGGPPRVKIGVAQAGAVAARDDVLGEIHALLYAAVNEAERRQRALLEREVMVIIPVPPVDPDAPAIAALSTRGQDEPPREEPASGGLLGILRADHMAKAKAPRRPH
jgi:hypothetical protein